MKPQVRGGYPVLGVIPQTGYPVLGDIPTLIPILGVMGHPKLGVLTNNNTQPTTTSARSASRTTRSLRSRLRRKCSAALRTSDASTDGRSPHDVIPFGLALISNHLTARVRASLAEPGFPGIGRKLAGQTGRHHMPPTPTSANMQVATVAHMWPTVPTSANGPTRRRELRAAWRPASARVGAPCQGGLPPLEGASMTSVTGRAESGPVVASEGRGVRPPVPAAVDPVAGQPDPKGGDLCVDAPADPTVYVAASGIGHWPDPIGVLLVTACQGKPMRSWRQVPAGEVPPEERCRGSGCAQMWRCFDARRARAATGPPSRRNGAVTDH